MVKKNAKSDPNQLPDVTKPAASLHKNYALGDIIAHNVDQLEQNLFQDIPYDLLQPILAQCSFQFLQKGKFLLSPNQENHNLYFLIEGALTVYWDTADSQLSFPIHRGECIGEMSIIEHRLTSAYVVAEEDSNVLVMPEEIFWAQFIHISGAVRNLLQVLTYRMRTANELALRTREKEIRYEQLQKELDAAGKIQTNILPHGVPLFPKHPQVDVCADLIPATAVGGDFFDAIAIDDQFIYIAIGDVCGKGMPAALLMVRVMALLRTTLKNNRSFATLLPEVNQALTENNDDSTFVSLFVGLFDVQSGRLLYTHAGHNPPFVSQGGAPFQFLDVPKSLVLGLLEQAQFPLFEITFQPGDVLMLYTDGITEAENTAQALFSSKRMSAVLNQVDLSADITTLVKHLQEAVFQFSKGQPQSDDITVLALRYLGDDTKQSQRR